MSELKIGYLDAVALGGTSCNVVEDIREVQAASTDLGLSLNISKCDVTTNDRQKIHGMKALQGFIFDKIDFTL
jgi:hypothetical protein